MKKLTAVLLCLLLLPLLSSCAVKPVDAYFDTMAEMEKIQEQNFTCTIEVESEQFADFGSSVSLVLDGSYSAKNKQMTATCTMALQAPKKITMELTDIILDNNKLYINIESLASSIFTLSGTSGMEDSMSALFGDNEYIMLDYDDYGMDIWEMAAAAAAPASSSADTSVPGASLVPLVQNLQNVVEGKIKSADPPVISAESEAYVLTMDGAFIYGLLNAIVDNMDENLDTYSAAIYDFYNEVIAYAENYIDNMGQSVEDLGLPEFSQAELKDGLREGLANVREALADVDPQDWAANSCSSSIIKGKDSYTCAIKMNWEDVAALNISYVITKAEIAAIKAPAKYTDMKTLIENLQDLTGLGGDDDYDYTYDFGDDDGDIVDVEIQYNLIRGADTQRFLGADTEGSKYLQMYTMNSGNTDTAYDLPAPIDNDPYISEYYISAGAKGVNLAYYALGIYGREGIITMMEDTVKSDIAIYESMDYTNARNSDMWLSADGKFALMGFCMDTESWSGDTTQYYKAYGMFSTGKDDNWGNEEIIRLEISVWEEEIIPATLELLAELGNIWGIDLPEYMLIR